jgi:flagellin-like hook-associated protein FlgL
MAITLGSNIASLRGQRQLSRTSQELGTVFQRLSSGQRINKASDDAAGLSIADSLNAQSRIINQGVRNLNDGQSLLSIADSAIENLGSIMIRLEELAEQAANGVYTNKQRKAMDDEAQALSKEFFRISKTTEFNGQRLLTGAFDAINLQAGVGGNAVLSTGVGGAIGTGTFDAAVSFTPGVGTGPFSVSTGDFNGDGVLDLVTADFDYQMASVLIGRGNGTFEAQVSYSVGINPYSVSTGDFNGDGVLDLVTADSGDSGASVLLGLGNGTFAPRISYSVGGTPRSVSTGDFNGDGVLDLVTADYGSNTASVLIGRGDGTFAPRVSYAVGSSPQSVSSGDFNGDGVLDLVTADQFTVSVLIGNGDGTFGPRTSYAAGEFPLSISTGDVNGDGVLDLVTANSGYAGGVSVLLGTTKDGVAPLIPFSLKTLANARQALPVFRRKNEQLAAQRGEIGAFQSRIDVARSVLEVSSENFRAAESRIRDADIAEESSRLVRLNILQQAASAILAQANQQPALALQLLTG